MGTKELCEGIDYELRGDENDEGLVLYVATAGETTLSSSGKSLVIASTRGNISIPGTKMKLGLNLYEPREGK